MEHRQIDRGKACCTRARRLEQTIEHPVTCWIDAGEHGIMELRQKSAFIVLKRIRKLTSSTMKKIMSRPLRITRIQNSHHVAEFGNSKVKQRLG